MNKKEIYSNYLIKIKEVVENDNFEWIDYILEYLYSAWVPDSIMEELEDVLHEMTLYSEFKEIQYKQEVLDIIKEYEENI